MEHKTTVYQNYVKWCMDNDFEAQSKQGFWLNLKRSRTELTDKKIRVGKEFKYVCSVKLKPVVEVEAVNEKEFLVAA